MPKKQKIFFILALILGLLSAQAVFADDASSGTPAIISNPPQSTSTAGSVLGLPSTIQNSIQNSSGSNGNSLQNSNSQNFQGIVLGMQTESVPALIQEIKNAKAQLKDVKLNYDLKPVYKKNKKGKTVISSYKLNAKDIALAVLDPADGSVKIAMGMQTGKTMKFSDPNFNIKLARFNGVNSSFKISKPENGSILALKYLITPTESGSQKTILNAMYESVYVPFSEALNSPEIAAYGQNYLNGVINKVAQDLRYIPSQAISGKQIVEAIPPAMIKGLIYAEHSDSGKVLYGNPQTALDQLNILFAVNEGDTYKYSVSSAGARGLAQFMPATYGSLVQRHPEAGLLPDFVAGMSDHTNAIKAMYLLIDDYAGAVRVKAATGFTEGQVFDYGAASYNGGTARVVKAINNLGAGWNEDRSGEINALFAQAGSYKSQAASLKAKIKKTADKKAKAGLQSQLATAQSQYNSALADLDTLKSSTLRQETVNYLKKIYKVIHLLNAEPLAIK